MKAFTIANKDMKIRLRDRKGFITLLLMPLVLTAILGSALSGLFSESGSIPDTSVGIVVSADDDLTDQFVNKILQGDELKESIALKEFNSKAALKKAVGQQQVDVGVIIPSGWGEGLMMGEVKEATILSDPEKEIQSTIMKSIMTSFIDRVTSVSIASEVVSKELSSAVPVSDQKVDVVNAVSGLANDLSEIAGAQLNAVTTKEGGKEPISGMQYYAAAMCAMFVLFNVTFGAKSIVQERKTETLARLLSSPIHRSSIITGKFLGTLYFSFLQFLVFVTATHYLFGVSWGSNILQVLVIGLAYSVTVAGFAMIIAGIITEEKTADTVGGIGVQILALLGGSMIPVATFPNSLQQLANIAPNKWALGTLLEIMNGTAWSTLILPVSVLVLSGLLALMVGSLKLRAR
ncbi:MAG TPA: ABC transporter permease [Bacillus bacterium]|uniref:Transport permease YfiM n=1 Tax=Siminovitchia fordii TaxID=254759 RepID=A0ABQ4K6T2_9BACI|nr:ABC transporter permease [Siminovitchia fordii]GIN21445.1 putative transport permease YfiM [Siminovitchia fordii]HBZ08819.1 ABC transporter permease [Bacillus sp. (in: firmicutes)]